MEKNNSEWKPSRVKTKLCIQPIISILRPCNIETTVHGGRSCDIETTTYQPILAVTDPHPSTTWRRFWQFLPVLRILV